MIARVAVLLALVAAVSAQTMFAKVKIVPSLQGSPSHPNVAGYVTFWDYGNGTTSINVQITGFGGGLPASVGMHIHAIADMVTNATAAGFDAGTGTFGSHWVGGGNTTFGCPETNVFPGFRAGCLGNWPVANNAINHTKYFGSDQINKMGIASPIGLGLLVHANTDPCNGDGTVYGTRLAGGVIGVVSDTAATAYTAPSITSAVAVCALRPTDFNASYSGLTGAVYFLQNGASSVIVKARISGLPDRLPHSMHVHQWGDISNAHGNATGGHWNPLTTRTHSIPNDEPRHAGDLGRIVDYDTNGVLWYSYTISSTSTEQGNAGFGNHPSIWYDTTIGSILGRGLIFHYGRDEGCLAPNNAGANSNGNAGGRLAQCTIGLATQATWNALMLPNTYTPTPQVGNTCRPPVAGQTPFTRAPGNSASSAAVSALFLILAALAVLFF